MSETPREPGASNDSEEGLSVDHKAAPEDDDFWADERLDAAEPMPMPSPTPEFVRWLQAQREQQEPDGSNMAHNPPDTSKP